MKSIVYGASIRGNDHYRTGSECQDSNSFSEEDIFGGEIKVIALSDGHGGATYCRSAEGSRFAVDITKKALHDFIVENKAILDELDHDVPVDGDAVETVTEAAEVAETFEFEEAEELFKQHIEYERKLSEEKGYVVTEDFKGCFVAYEEGYYSAEHTRLLIMEVN